jgi:hypothetical protein
VQQSLNLEQKVGLWDALVWAVLYERTFRPNKFKDPFPHLLTYLKGCAGDTAYLGYVYHHIDVLLMHLERARVADLRTMVAQLPSSSEVTRLQALLDARLLAPEHPTSGSDVQPLPPEDREQIVRAIRRLWFLLDKKLESSNQKSFDQARQNLASPETAQRLATLGGVICRNVVFRYRLGSNLPGGTLSEAQLRDAIALAEFAKQQSSGDYVTKAAYHALLLTGLSRMRTHTLDAESFVMELAKTFGNEEQSKAAGFSWADVLGMVTHHLAERRKAGMVDTVEAEAWIHAFVNQVQHLDPTEKKAFVAEVRQHGVRESMALRTLQGGQEREHSESAGPPDDGPLSFLGSERRKELLECIRHSHLERLNEILRENRPKLLAELSRVLADHVFGELLAPRRSLRMRGRHGNAPDRFPEAKRLILSDDLGEQREGLALFDRAAAETTFHEYIPLAREWRLFASACVNGPAQAVPQWEEDRTKGLASWEEIWNLAVFYVRINLVKQALEVLQPGVQKARAPFAHLRFALYCSVQILVQEKRVPKDTVDAATSFLIENLKKMPLPICYLAWQLLINESQSSHESQDSSQLMKQLEILGKFQTLLDLPLTMLNPEENLADASVQAFEKHLQRLGLEEVWRLWINDYAEHNRFKFSLWQALSDACDRAGDVARAEEALLHIVSTQLDTYQRNVARKSESSTDLGYLRGNLVRLFDFYQRKARLEDRDVEAMFKRYSRAVPALWDGKDPANSKLIKLTRPLLEKVGGRGEKRSVEEVPGLPQPSRVWYLLATEFPQVQDVSGLKRLQQRLSATIELLAGEQKLAKERATVVIKVLNELCALDANTWKEEELSREVNRLNGAIQDAAALVGQETALKPVKALIEVFRRVFKAFSEARHLSPTLRVDPTPLGAGIPRDIAETALVLQVSNPGPGEVTNVQATCTDKGIIASNRPGTLDRLAQGETSVVAIPVRVRPEAGSQQVECQVNMTYRWGIIEDATSSHAVKARLFAFPDYLQQHSLYEHDFPNPYIFDQPLDFSQAVHHRLFHGRESELALIRTVFFKGQMSGAPLYFHGIRRVGKTSLLHRMALVLKERAFAPYVIDLKGIRASQQSLPIVLNSFTQRILDDVQNQGLDIQGLKSVPEGYSNPVMGVEQFFTALRERTGKQQLVLLLDEFYLMVAENTTALLDLLRRVHESGRILFIMSGWFRPEILRRLCPETQLAMTGRPIDFLPLPVVKQILHEPIATFGIEIPDSTVQQVFLQTAGNPYHVAKIAYNGIVRLNAEHRTVFAPQDADEIANQLAAEPANFTSSSFSPLILTDKEQEVAIGFAKHLEGKSDVLPFEEARRLFPSDILQAEEERQQYMAAEGKQERDFFIDDLNTILRG